MELSLIVVLMFEAVSLETVHPGSHRAPPWDRSALGERCVCLGPVPSGRVLVNRDCSAIAGCRKRSLQIAL